MDVDQTRQEAITIAQRVIENQPLYLDTETTGLGPQDEIVEISILDHDGEVVIDSLVRPSKPIPQDAIAIHGITNAMVSAAQTWKSIWPEVEAVINGKQVAIYNAEYDLRMLKQSTKIQKIPWQVVDVSFFDIMQLYANFYGDWNSARGSFRWQSLLNAGKQAGISLPNSHRAKDDAALARAVLHAIATG